MVHQQRSVTIMTGISGVAASHLAHTLATRLVGEWSVVSLEDFLAEADRNIRGDESKQYIVEILNQPEPALESLWLEAFRLAKTAVGRALSNSSVLFTLHATWLSPESTSITAGSDPQSLGQVDWNVSKVINFIDDVYDCYERLSGQGGILRRQKGKTLDKEVLDLLLLLEWREAEFRQSQQIARALSVNGTTVPTYMVAVKHPLATIVRLVESADPNTVYLSHPITLLRTAQGGIGSHPLIDEIQTTAAILRRSEIVLFEPTAIDERRFNFDTADEPLLSERWPAFVDINGDEESALFERDRDQPFKRLLLANERFGKDIPGAVKILEDRIDRQINWRDRQLVIQSNSLVVLRPFARDSGVVSGGVRVEAELHAGLARVGRYATGAERFFDTEDRAYRLHLSRLAFDVSAVSEGAVIDRISHIYDEIYIDEVQDLTGCDLRIVEQLMHQSNLDIYLVGDVRQSVFDTNPRDPNLKQYRGVKMVDWFELHRASGLLEIKHQTETWRSNQAIADFSDAIFPATFKFDATVSRQVDVTGHDGVFAISETDVSKYMTRYSPQLLRASKSTARESDLPFRNFGKVKGLTFDRVLIYPTSAIARFLTDGTGLKDSSACGLYVAVTRARHSVAFVVSNPAHTNLIPWHM